MLTTRPHFASSMIGTTARMQKKAPVALTRSIASHMSSVVSDSLALPAMPALLTRISGSPRSFLTRMSMASTWLCSATSHRPAAARRPMARRAPAVSSSTSAFRPETATSAPACASETAMARPIPRPPPVMSATRPVSSANSALAQDLCQFGQIDVAAGDDASDPATAGLPRERHGEGHRTRTFGDHPVPFGHQPEGRRDLIETGCQRSVEELLRHDEHAVKDRLAADPIDERWLVIDHLRRARLQGGGERRAGIRLHRVDANRRFDGAPGGRDPTGKPAPSPGNEHAVHVGEVLQQL